MRITAAACLIVVACAPTPMAESPQSFCSVAKPIVLDKKDVLTKATLSAVLAINESGVKLCGWKRP